LGQVEKEGAAISGGAPHRAKKRKRKEGKVAVVWDSTEREAFHLASGKKELFVLVEKREKKTRTGPQRKKGGKQKKTWEGGKRLSATPKRSAEWNGEERGGRENHPVD